MKNFITKKLFNKPADSTLKKWLWFTGLYVSSLIVIGTFMWLSHSAVALLQHF